MNKKTKKGDYLDILLRSKRTVFSTSDIALLWGEASTNATLVRLNYYVKTGKLIRVHRGLYAKDPDYDKYELATKIYTPSYISLETVLGANGVTFQFYSTIFVVSYQTKEIKCDGQKYSYHRIKDSILTNQTGVEVRNNYSIAVPERAFLDVIYLHKDYHFDNLSLLNWDKVYGILPIYGGNKRMAKMVKMYNKDFTGESVTTSNGKTVS